MELLWAIASCYVLLPYTSALFPLPHWHLQLPGLYRLWISFMYHLPFFFQIIKPKITLELAQAVCHLDK